MFLHPIPLAKLTHQQQDNCNNMGNHKIKQDDLGNLVVLLHGHVCQVEVFEIVEAGY